MKTFDFVLPADLEAHEPPEPRDRVRLLLSTNDVVTHHEFRDLPNLLKPGDLLVVNTSATLPAAVRLDRLTVHFSTPVVTGAPNEWIVELRLRGGKATTPYSGGAPGEWFPLPGGATLTLVARFSERLWHARLSTAVIPYLRRYGVPIRYGYVRHDWPIAAYQTVFARGRDGSAEMPSAARPFTAELVARLASRGVLFAPLTLHTGVASPEAHEPPYAERFEIPDATADLVNHVRARGDRVIAVGTTVVRALETAVDSTGLVQPARGWTEHVVTPEAGVRAVGGLLTGLHEPRSSHLMMLTAIAGPDLLARTYDEALAARYLWHEFGDLNLILP